MSCLEFWTNLHKYFAQNCSYMAWDGIYVWFDLPLWPLVVTEQLQIIVVTMRGRKRKQKCLVYPASFQRRWVVQDFSLFVKDQESKHLPNLGHQYCVNLFCLSEISCCDFRNNKNSFGGAVVAYNDEESVLYTLVQWLLLKFSGPDLNFLPHS